jgi:hypothetical protein
MREPVLLTYFWVCADSSFLWMSTVSAEELVKIINPTHGWTQDWGLDFDLQSLLSKGSIGLQLNSPIISPLNSQPISYWSWFDELLADESHPHGNITEQQPISAGAISTSDAALQTKSMDPNATGSSPFCAFTAEVPSFKADFEAVAVQKSKRKLDDPSDSELSSKSSRTSEGPCPPRSVFVREEVQPVLPAVPNFTRENLLEHLPGIPIRQQVWYSIVTHTKIWR